MSKKKAGQIPEELKQKALTMLETEDVDTVAIFRLVTLILALFVAFLVQFEYLSMQSIVIIKLLFYVFIIRPRPT